MQNLRNDAGGKQNVLIRCAWCTRKFKTQRKYEKHVTTQHPFAASNKNTETLLLDEKMWLLDELERYSNILINGSSDDFRRATQALSDEERMHQIHSIFRERIVPLLNKALSSGDQVLRLLDDFQAFLNLGIPWRGGNFCPSLLIDLVWHSAMQNKERYVAMCTHFLRQALPHCLIENDGNEDRFDEFTKQFIHQHGREHVKPDDLIYGNDGNGIIAARNRLKSAEESRLLKERIFEEEWRARQRARELDIECQKRDGTYVEPPRYMDDGKC